MKYGLNSKNDLTRKRLFSYNISVWLKTWKIKIKLKIKIFICDFDVYKITIYNRLHEDGSNWVAETCRSNLNKNKLINEKLICAFRWSVLPSIVTMFRIEKAISQIC